MDTNQSQQLNIKEAIGIQQQFFALLKNSMPSHVSMADELSEKMGLSYDSIYRRIRGEKALSMLELKMLCQQYNISLDQVFDIQNSTVVFNVPDINTDNLPFQDYLKGLVNGFKHINSYAHKKMRYLCKDMSLWQFFLFPELSAFKLFFWIKTIQNDTTFNKAKFCFEKYGFDEIFAIGQQLIREYNQIPSIELWNIECTNSTIKQIEYYRDAGLFENRKEMTLVIDSFWCTIDHIQLQAEKGFKFMPGDTEVRYKAPQQFYINEVILGNNTMMIESDEIKETWATYNVMNYMITKDPRYSKRAFASFDNLVSRSTLISNASEKERNRYFNLVKDKINLLKA